MAIIELYRVRIDPANVARLLEIRGAMAELRKQLPELWQADLVRLDDQVWLDIQTWSKAVDPARIGKAAERTAIIAEMHGLITAQLGHDRGERAHTTGTAWAAGR